MLPRPFLAWNIGYNAAQIGNLDLPTSLTAPNGTSSSFSYDSLERLTGVQHQQPGGALLSSFAYGYDNVLHKDALQSTTSQLRDATGTLGAAQTVNFGYDRTNQLQSETSTEPTPLLTLAHSYDGMGNRTQDTNAAAQTQSTSTYNALNQLTSLATSSTANNTVTPLSTAAFGYDGAGNLTGLTTLNQQTNTSSSTTYTYDDCDRLTGIVNPGVSETLLQYDGFDRLRISRSYVWQNNAWVLNSEKHRLYAGLDVVQERDGNNAVTANLTRAGNIGGILARTTTAGTLYYHCDGNGNVVQLADSTGTVQASYTYDAYGEILSQSGSAATANPYCYQSKEEIAGLYEFGYRFYNPNLGRWLNRDPLEEGGGLNLYGYVGNDPEDEGDGYGEWYVLVPSGWGDQRGYEGWWPPSPSVAPAAGPLRTLPVVGGAGAVIPISPDKILGPPTVRGKPPTGIDGHPVELHHCDQTNGGDLQEITRSDHRLGDNFKKNHDNTGKSKSEIERNDFGKVRDNHWKKDWDRGRWNQNGSDRESPEEGSGAGAGSESGGGVEGGGAGGGEGGALDSSGRYLPNGANLPEERSKRIVRHDNG